MGSTFEHLGDIIELTTGKRIRTQSLSLVLRRILFILVGKNIDGFDETWPKMLGKTLLNDGRCGQFVRDQLKIDPEKLHPIFLKFGASTLSKALETSTARLEDLIESCSGQFSN